MRRSPVREPSADSPPDRRKRSRRAEDRFPVPRLYGAWVNLKTGFGSLLMIKEAWHFWTRLISTMGEE